jgi:translation initiation factor IF-3
VAAQRRALRASVSSTSNCRRREGRTILRGKKTFREPPPLPEHRINDRINFSPVRLIGHDGAQIGIVPLELAKEKAQEQGMDLVEVAPEARPIVCKIMDYGRFLYEQEKKAKEAKKRQQTVEIKEVKLRPAIDDHDFQTKVKMAERFLRKGNKVKVTVMFRRREMRRPENGYEVLARVQEELADIATVEQMPPPTLEGRDLSMVLRQA